MGNFDSSGNAVSTNPILGVQKFTDPDEGVVLIRLHLFRPQPGPTFAVSKKNASRFPNYPFWQYFQWKVLSFIFLPIRVVSLGKEFLPLQ